MLQPVAQQDRAFGQVRMALQVRRQAVQLQGHSRQFRAEYVVQVAQDPPPLFLTGDDDTLRLA